MKRLCLLFFSLLFFAIVVTPAVAAWKERTVFVLFFSQKDSRWASDTMVKGYTIKSSGCLMTNSTAVLTYYYVSTDPSTVNAWLSSHHYYRTDGTISSWKWVADYTANKVSASQVTTSDKNVAITEILSGRPCIIKVATGASEHWLLARGYENGKFTINDPLDTSFQLKQYGGSIYAVVKFSSTYDPGLDKIFNDCRDRNGGTGRVGSLTNDYHYWGSLTVRDYNGGSYGWDIICYLYPNAGVRKAYLVRTGFWEKWRSMNGPYSFLGMPVTDEYVSFKYGMRARQDFADGGYMVWYDDHVQIYDWKGQALNAVAKQPQTDPKAVTNAEVSLGSAYPNPCNPSTTIVFHLPEQMTVNLAIYDVQGREIALLAEGLQEAGDHEVHWQGEDSHGMRVASGVYFYRLQAGNQLQTKKLLLLK